MAGAQTTKLNRQLVPHELPEQVDEELRRLRAMTNEERSGVIVAVCQLAADIEAGKRKMGLPPSKRDPIPPAILEFFRQRIADGQR